MLSERRVDEGRRIAVTIIMLKLYLRRDEDATVIAVCESEENGASCSQEYYSNVL